MSVQTTDDGSEFERSAPALRRIALAILRDEARIDDVLQEAWLMTRRCKPSDFMDERAWLAAVVRNLARNSRRSERRLASRERAASRPERLESTAEIAARGSVVERLGIALKRLPELERTALELRFVEQLELKQIAARLGRPVPTLKHQIRRGLDGLRRELDAEFGDGRAWSLGLVAAFDWKEAEVSAALSAGGAGGGALSISVWSAVVVAAALGVGLWLRGRSPAEPLAQVASQHRSSAQQTGDVRAADALARVIVRTETQPDAAQPLAETGALGPIDAQAEAAVVDLLVVDASGRPVADAAILSAGQPPAESSQLGRIGGVHARTDAEGRARILLREQDLLRDRGFGRYTQIVATARGLAASEAYNAPLQEGDVRVVRIVLDAPEVVLEGRALDALGRALEEGMVVLAPLDKASPRWIDGVLREDVASRSSSVGPGGTFGIENLRPGTYQALVRDPRTGIDDEVLDLGAPGLHVLDLNQSSGVVLRGRVLDSEGRPIAGAEVWFEYDRKGQWMSMPFEAAVRSDSDGAFAMPASSGTRLRIYARERGEGGLRGTLDVLPDANALEPLDLVLEKHVTTTFEVRDAGGAPRPDLLVMVQRTSATNPRVVDEGFTDAEGRVHLDLLEPTSGEQREGTLDVVLSDISRSFSLPELVIPLPPLTDEPIRIVYEPLAPGSITGHVTVSGWERPFALRLWISCSRTFVSASFQLPAEAGSFSMDSVPPGTYLLAIEGRESLLEPLGTFEVEAGSTLDLGARGLPPPGHALFDLRFPSTGPAVPPAQFVVQRSGLYGAWSSRELREEPLELLPGEYVLVRQAQDGTIHRQSFEIESGVESWVVVDL